MTSTRFSVELVVRGLMVALTTFFVIEAQNLEVAFIQSMIAAYATLRFITWVVWER